MAQQIPEHITPRALYSMSGDEIEKLLEGIRERRLHTARVYEQAQRDAKEAADEKARNALFKQCEMMKNNLERLDKAMESAEARINKIRALRLELGLE